MSALRIQALKEARALLPWWAASVATMVSLGLLHSLELRWMSGHALRLGTTYAYFGGAVALGALSVGHEFSHRTLPGLLAQPVRRARLLVIKLAVLALAILSLMALFLITPSVISRQLRSGADLLDIVPVLCGLFVAPALTLLCRSALAGAVFSVALPFVGASLIAALGWQWRPLEITAAFAILGGITTWERFLRLELVDGGSAGAARGWRRRSMTPSASSAGWLRQTLGKELRLQSMTFALAAAYTALWIASVLASKGAGPYHSYGPFMAAVTNLYVGVVGVLAGALTAAEERRHQTEDWHLLLPVAAWKLWTTKVIMAVTTTTVLGIALPVLVGFLVPVLDSRFAVPIEDEQMLLVAGFIVVGLYMSSVCSSGLRALLTSFPVMAVSVVVFAMVMAPWGSLVDGALTPAALRFFEPQAIDSRTAVRIGEAIGVTLITGLMALLLWLGYRNYVSLDRGRDQLTRQVVWIATYVVLATGVAASSSAIVQAASQSANWPILR